MPSYTLGELAAILNGVVYGEASRKIQGVASLANASTGDLAYFDNPNRISLLTHTRASAVLLSPSMQMLCPVDVVVVSNPFIAMAEAVKLLTHEALSSEMIHPSACVDLTAILGKRVSIGANTFIAAGVEIGDNTVIGANCVLETGVLVGTDCVLQNGVMVHQGSQLGNAVCIDSGVVIGAQPFNAMKRSGRWHFGPAIGGVLLGDRCQVGANTVIDRGSVSDTCLAEGVILDNLIQLGHDALLGSGTAVAACATIGAHVSIGKHCIIGGACTIAANIELSDDVVVTGMSTVNQSLLKSGIYSSGTTVSEHKTWRRNAARFKQLDLFVKRLKRLENKFFNTQAP